MYVFLATFDQWINISQEINLQEEIANETEGFISTSKVLNASLHTMAAHLHRYKTELQRVDLVLSDLRKHRRDMTYRPKPRPRDREEYGKQVDEKEDDEEEFPPIDRELQKIEQLASQLAATSSFADEMERKVQNILALVSQRFTSSPAGLTFPLSYSIKSKPSTTKPCRLSSTLLSRRTASHKDSPWLLTCCLGA